MHVGQLSEEGKSQAKATPTARGRHGNKPRAKVREPRVSHGLEAREPPWSCDPQVTPTAQNSEQSPLGTAGQGARTETPVPMWGHTADSPARAGEAHAGRERQVGGKQEHPPAS